MIKGVNNTEPTTMRGNKGIVKAELASSPWVDFVDKKKK